MVTPSQQDYTPNILFFIHTHTCTAAERGIPDPGEGRKEGRRLHLKYLYWLPHYVSSPTAALINKELRQVKAGSS